MSKTFKGVVSFDVKVVMSAAELEQLQSTIELDVVQESLTSFGEALTKVMKSQDMDAAIRMLISHVIREGVKDTLEELVEDAVGMFKLSYSPASVRLTGVTK